MGTCLMKCDVLGNAMFKASDHYEKGEADLTSKLTKINEKNEMDQTYLSCPMKGWRTLRKTRKPILRVRVRERGRES